MTNRLCPECDTRSDGEVCPKCGTRTFFEAESDAGVDPLLGQVLDQRYRIEERIGRGGMGTVYRAVQIAMNKVVAVKVMNPELARNTEAVKRFHREAKAATAFDHPHAIRLIDFGQAASRELFMVMEFLDGRALSKVLRDESPFPLVRAAKVAGEIAKALAAAHAVGLVHRDMKPDNVFLLDVAGDEDFVKVLDFGIAKFVSGTNDSTMTRTGLIVGTPQFMAPEQAQADKALSSAVDVYALGVMLYAMLVGRHPFKGDTPLDALMAHINQPVPVLPDRMDVPDEMRALIQGMLAKDPERRPTASEISSILERVRLIEMAQNLVAEGGAKTKVIARTPYPAEECPPRPRIASLETSLSAPSFASGEPAADDDVDEIGATRRRPGRGWIWAFAGVAGLAAIGALLWLYHFNGTPREPAGASEKISAPAKEPPKVAPVREVVPPRDTMPSSAATATAVPAVAVQPRPTLEPATPAAVPAPTPAPSIEPKAEAAPVAESPPGRPGEASPAPVTRPVAKPLERAPTKAKAKPASQKGFEEIW